MELIIMRTSCKFFLNKETRIRINVKAQDFIKIESTVLTILS